MSYDRRVEVLERHLTAENAHDMRATLATLTADCEFVDHALGVHWSEHRGAEEHYTMWWNAFDVEVVGEQLHLTEHSAVAETTWRGRHIGWFAGVDPTDRPVELAVAVAIELRDGLLAGERFYWDAAGLARQLGVASLGSLVSQGVPSA